MHSFSCPKQAVKTKRPKWEISDIFRAYGEDYRHEISMPANHLKIMNLIKICRTDKLGGHILKCNACGHEKNAYNSCRNRHCPKCQTLTKERWLNNRKSELLPVRYFHSVFTLPHELNPITLANKKVIFKILFKAASETLQTFAEDPRWKLGAQLGFIAVLHTWSQKLLDHFHLHCLVPAGALSHNKKRWIPTKNRKYLFCVKALSIVFKNKFLDYLKEAFNNHQLIFPGTIATLKSKQSFYKFLNPLYDKNWIVYSKRPFAGPSQVLEYLARYTHRVAISNNRILSMENGKVRFSYKDRADNNKTKELTISAHEFIRRFFLHALPDNFMRIRYFGFLANVSKKTAIDSIFRSLGKLPNSPEKIEETTREMMLRITGIDITRCPQCKKGTMIDIGPTLKRSNEHDP